MQNAAMQNEAKSSFAKIKWRVSNAGLQDSARAAESENESCAPAHAAGGVPLLTTAKTNDAVDADTSKLPPSAALSEAAPGTTDRTRFPVDSKGLAMWPRSISAGTCSEPNLTAQSDFDSLKCDQNALESTGNAAELQVIDRRSDFDSLALKSTTKMQGNSTGNAVELQVMIARGKREYYGCP